VFRAQEGSAIILPIGITSRASVPLIGYTLNREPRIHPTTVRHPEPALLVTGFIWDVGVSALTHEAVRARTSPGNPADDKGVYPVKLADFLYYHN